MFDIREHGGIFGGKLSNKPNYIGIRLLSTKTVSGLSTGGYRCIPYYFDKDTILLSPYLSTGSNYKYKFSDSSLTSVATGHDTNSNTLPKARVGDYWWCVDYSSKKIYVYTSSWVLLKTLSLSTSNTYKRPAEIVATPSGDRVTITICYDDYNGLYEVFVYNGLTSTQLYKLSSLRAFVTKWFITSSNILIGGYGEYVYYYNASTGAQVGSYNFGAGSDGFHSYLKDNDTLVTTTFNSSTGFEYTNVVRFSMNPPNPSVVLSYSNPGLNGIAMKYSRPMKYDNGKSDDKRISLANSYGNAMVAVYYYSNWSSGVGFILSEKNSSNVDYSRYRYFAPPDDLFSNNIFYGYYEYPNDPSRCFVEKYEILDK